MDVYLREDVDDLAVQIDPAAHLARVDQMQADGWEIDDEQTLRV